MRSRLVVPAFVVFLLLAAPLVVLACGGLFASVPIDQTAERMIFTVNGDGTITAVVGIGYEGDPAEFSWILPVPSVPSAVEVAETDDLDRLQELTNRVFTPPPDYCAGASVNQGFGGGGGITYGAVGPYEYVVIDNDDPDELIAWLQDKGYAIPDAAVPVIEDYVAMGMKFLAMRLAPSAGVDDIQPVRVTFTADQPMIPIRLAAAASAEILPLYVWIFGDTRYAPENWADAEVDFTQIRGRIGHFAGGDTNYYGGTNYAWLLNDLQAEYDGKFFVTEYAMPTSDLPAQSVAESALLTEFTDRFAYVTRLYGQLAPEQMTLDPMFAPVADAANQPNRIDLTGIVDPLEFFGCTTRFFYDPDLEALLPNRTHIDDVDHNDFNLTGIDVRYPEGWTLQQVTDPNGSEYDSPVYVIAPEEVTWDTFAAFARGEETPPMMVFRATYSMDYYTTVYGTLVPDDLFELPDDRDSHQNFVLHVPGDWYYPTSVTFEILTTNEDWQANAEQYNAMLRYPKLYQFYRSATLRNTLYFGVLNMQNEAFPNYGVLVGYPEGWGERIENEEDQEFSDLYQFGGRITLSPFTVLLEPEVETEGSPHARLIPMTKFGFSTETRTFDVNALAEAYGLDAAVIEAAMPRVECRTWSTITEAVPYTTGERSGFIRFDFSGSGRPYLIDASVDTAQFAQYEELLRDIALSADNEPEYMCG